MTAYDPLYLLQLMAPRSIDPDEATVLTPIAGAAHSQPFRVATRHFGKAVRIGATTGRRLERAVVGTWPTTAFTIEYWGRLDAGLIPGALPNFGFSYAVAGSFNEILFGAVVTAASWRLRCEIDGTAALDDDAASFPDDNKYHHHALTWQASDGAVAMYIDGTLVQTGTRASGGAITGGGYLILGQEQDALGGGLDSNQAWKGELDEVRVYSRVLTAAEIKQHAGGIYIDETGLCARWGFDLAGGADIGKDSSSAGNHLTPVGITEGTDDTVLHFYPYLQPPAGRSGRIDRLNKRTDVGVQSFRIVDAALTPGQNLTRWATSAFGDAKGRLRVGNLRAIALESTDGGLTLPAFWHGRVRQASLVEPNLFELRVRELADDTEGLAFVGRPHASIPYAGFPTLLPIGLSVPYGSMKAVTPLTGSIGAFNINGMSIPNARFLRVTGAFRPDNIITKTLLGQLPSNSYEAIGSLGGGDAIVGRIPVFSAGPVGARVKLKRLDTQAVGYFKIGAFRQVPAPNNHQQIQSLAIGELATNDVGYMAFPPNGTAVEFTIEGEHRASKTTPLVIGDVHLVTLWKHLLEGKFGFLWTPPEVLPTGRSYGDARMPVPYNTTKMATLEADARFPIVRGIVTKREPRGKWCEENLLRLGNLTYYRDGHGVIQPVDLRLPSDVASVPTITDADLAVPEGQAWPTWDYDRAQAITRIEAAHYTDLPTAIEDIAASGDVYPEIQSAGFTEVRHPIAIIDLGSADLGDEPYELDAKLLRSLPDELLGTQQRETYFERRLIDLSTEIARPFQVGAPTSVMPVRRGGPGDAQPGEVRKTTVSTLVDPGTNKRGGTRLVQVLERTPRGPYLELRVVDLGLSTAGGVPTLGAPAQETGNTLQGVTVNVTVNGDSHPVEVHYAVTETSVGVRPAESDAAWTGIPDRLVRATGDVSFRSLPPGKRIWLRARTFPDARVDWKLPSAWVFPSSGTGYVDLAALSAPSAPASANISGKSFRVSWTVGNADLPVELLIATPTTDPRTSVKELPPGSTSFDFPGDTGVVISPSTTYRVGIRHRAGAGAVSAEVTIDVTTTATPNTAPATGGFAVLVGGP